MARTLVTGDIHGAFKALLQLMERAQVNEHDTLIFIGDYVDGWSGSFDVIEFLIRLEEKNKCIFIRGNHDIWCQQWLEEGIADEIWLFNGGQSTVDSYSGKTEQVKIAHLHFFQRMRDFYIDEQNRLFVHAGFASMHGPEKEPYSSNYSWDRTLWEMALTMDNRIKKDSALYPRRLKLFTEIFIGHTPTLHIEKSEPVNAVNVWNVDTGVAFTGKLSTMDVDTKQFWQSDPAIHLYPGEPGRNNS